MSSRRAIRRRACGSKIRHKSERAANKQVQSLGCAKGDWLRAYFCGSCGGWHIGHKTRRPTIGPDTPDEKGQQRDPLKLPPYDIWILTFGENGVKLRKEANEELSRWADDGGMIPLV